MAVAFVAIAMGALSASSGLIAQTQTIDFVAPAGTPVTVGTGGDVLIFTGRAIGTMETGTCGSTSSGPVHNAIVIDPGSGGRPTFDLTVIVVSQSDPVNPGTKLTDLHVVGGCEISGGPYIVYRGDVK